VSTFSILYEYLYWLTDIVDREQVVSWRRSQFDNEIWYQTEYSHI